MTTLTHDTFSTTQKAQSRLSQFFREHKELLARLAKAKTRVTCCAAKLINYFERWANWKEPLYRTRWVYQPLKQIHDDLLGEHSLHVIREALALLERVGFLSRRSNNRRENWRNGQDRTYQYLLHTGEILKALAQAGSSSPQTGTSKNLQLQFNWHTAAAEDLPSRATAQASFKASIQSPAPILPNGLSLLEAETLLTLPGSKFKIPLSLQREQESLQESVGGICVYEKSTVNAGDSTLNLGDSTLNLGNSDLTNGFVSMVSASSPFESAQEREGFYQALLELGRHKSGVRSPVGWAANIMKSIDQGEPCEYLNEYRRGEALGTCEKEEWEVAPGRPFDNFVSYLKRQMESVQGSAEKAIDATFRALRDTNQARTLWQGYKRHIANLAEDWQEQQALGVTIPYIPAEVLPEREVSIEQAATAIQTLQSGYTQPALAPNPEPTPELPAAEPTQEEEVEAKERALSQAELMRANLKSGNPFKVGLARMWLRACAKFLDVVVDESGEIVDFAIAAEQPSTEEVEESAIAVPTEEPQPEENSLKVGDGVFVNSCPHTDKHGPFPIQQIEGDFAKVEMFAKLLPLSDLRRS